jgi:alpha,alpha-trehalose phosphorylase
VDVRAATTTTTLLDGEPIRIMHHGQPVTVSLSDPVVRPIPAAPPRSPEPVQPLGREPNRRLAKEAAGTRLADKSRHRHPRHHPPGRVRACL